MIDTFQAAEAQVLFDIITRPDHRYVLNRIIAQPGIGVRELKVQKPLKAYRYRQIFQELLYVGVIIRVENQLTRHVTYFPCKEKLEAVEASLKLLNP